MTTTYRPKLWTSLTCAVIIGSGTLAACSKPEDKSAKAVASEAEANKAPAPVTAAAGEGAGGEAGSNDAYAQIPAASTDGLRVAHLRGFFMIAEVASRTQTKEAAAMLAGQGMAEIYDYQADAYTRLGLKEDVLRKAAETGTTADLQAALKALDAAATKAGGKSSDIVKGMLTMSTGLYGDVIRDGKIDPTEYQHSLGAALSTREAAKRDPKLKSVMADLDAYVKLWPTEVPPTDVKALLPKAKVQAQSSRIELALSSL